MLRKRLSESIAIDAPPDAVWAVLADLPSWPDWTPTLDSLELVDEGDLHVGQRARIDQPGVRPATWTVTELDPGRCFVWAMSVAGMRVAAGHRVQAAESGAHLEIWIEVGGFTAPFLGWIVRRKARENLPLEARAAKSAAEAG